MSDWLLVHYKGPEMRTRERGGDLVRWGILSPSGDIYIRDSFYGYYNAGRMTTHWEATSTPMQPVFDAWEMPGLPYNARKSMARSLRNKREKP